MSVTYSPRDLFRETEKIYNSMYDTPLSTEGSFLQRVDACLQHISNDLGIETREIDGSACYIIAQRLSDMETALFGDTGVVVEDDITVSTCIMETKRVRKRLTRSSKYCPFS